MITVSALISAPVQEVWEKWTNPKHVINWNFASDDWCCPSASGELKVGGIFTSRMEAKDGSFGFDFACKYTRVVPFSLLEYTMIGADRSVKVEFIDKGDRTEVIESFVPEEENSYELQQQGWQAILNNFKKYAEQ